MPGPGSGPATPSTFSFTPNCGWSERKRTERFLSGTAASTVLIGRMTPIDGTT